MQRKLPRRRSGRCCWQLFFCALRCSCLHVEVKYFFALSKPFRPQRTPNLTGLGFLLPLSSILKGPGRTECPLSRKENYSSKILSTRRGIRTRTPRKEEDFKSPASTIPPPGHILKLISAAGSSSKSPADIEPLDMRGVR